VSDQQIKDIFGAAVSYVAPDRLDVDAMVADGRRRRRIRTSSTLAVAAAVIALVAGVLLASRPHTGTVAPVGPAPSAGVAVPIPTSTWTSGDAGMAALLEATLTLRSDGCLVAAGNDGAVIVWPAGYTAARFGPSFVVVRDSGGTVVAQTGVPLRLGGGEGAPATGPCLAPHSTHWNVNQDPPFVADPTVHLGTVVVPTLIGLSRADAGSALIAAGLTTGQVSSLTPPTVKVTAQSPAGGAEVAPGTDLRLSFEGVPEPVTTGLRGLFLPEETCGVEIAANAQLIAITEPVERFVICPPLTDSTARPVASPTTLTPASGAAFDNLDSALRLPDEITPLGTRCPAPFAPRIVVLAVTASGTSTVHLPLVVCGSVNPQVFAALTAA
jgi:hypothetical protein